MEATRPLQMATRPLNKNEAQSERELSWHRERECACLRFVSPRERGCVFLRLISRGNGGRPDGARRPRWLQPFEEERGGFRPRSLRSAATDSAKSKTHRTHTRVLAFVQMRVS
eukprot:1090509-Rhodomonas_salina.3